jgi:hypothetical protein
MAERPKYGTSTNNPKPSEPDITTSPLTLRAQEELAICKSGPLTQVGGKYSPLKVNTLSTQPIARFSMSLDQRTRKVKQSELQTEMTKNKKVESKHLDHQSKSK